ncbi:MAG: 3-hydroxybutyryl-CoA dehydrogenase [Cyclobacteriaceae bacterium]|jgi:3-hydroxybutyryl-CoA dehydrogenase
MERKMFEQVGVIGAGTIGIGVAIDMAIHELDVVLVDISNEQLEVALSQIKKTLKAFPLVAKRKLQKPIEEILKKITFTTDIEEVEDSDFIVENVTEEWSIKERVYKDLDRICRPEVCFGMNTSCTSITQISSKILRREKVIGVHFMNPVYAKSTVEAIRGYHTSQETIQTLEDILNLLGKDYVLVDDFPGFVSNRISHLFMNEAAFVVQDRVADPREVDKIFKKCFGHSMGPLETADLIGLDTVVNSLDVLYHSFQDTKFRCCPLLRKMVHAGNIGRKSGKGFFEYPSY